MFTVCPKCALTLAVTAADLRVAQGYVRCGRCSNVFNALARLSDDRQAAKPVPEPPARDTGATGRMRTSTASTTSRSRVLSETGALTAPPGLRREATRTTAAGAQQPPPSPAAAPAPPSPRAHDEPAIPDDALEFNPDSTDIDELFIEQPPTPEFRSATGTFRALREAEESARSPLANPDRAGVQFDVELDSELLAEITGNRLTRLDPTPTTPAAPTTAAAGAPASAPTTQAGPAPSAAAVPGAPAPAAPAAPAARAAAPTAAAPALADPAPAALAPAALAPAAPAAAGPALAGTAPASAARASAVPVSAASAPAASAAAVSSAGVPTRPARAASGARASPLETAEAIRNALVPRKKPAAARTATDAAPAIDPRALAWTGGTILMALLLLVQVIHHFRNDLAATSELHGPLTSLYAAFGVTLVPRWNLSSYEVRQLGATTDAASAGHITVRASVKNGARQPKPMPLLRVTLQDRFGNRIASRDVPPQSYLPRAIPVGTLLSPGQRIDAEMVFVDPGTNAVGFEIDACLPAPGGGITCANDVASR